MYEILKQFGFDEEEAKIYMALLELGPSTVTQITKRARITRTLGYVILDKLGGWGLVTRVNDGGKKIKYVAEHPRNFVQYIKNKKNSWERKLGSAEKLLPELVSVYKPEAKPTIRYQEGVKAIINIFEESLESKGEILSVTDVESWQSPEFWDWAKKYNRERNRNKIKERILLLDTKKAREWIKNYRPSPYTIYRWVTREQAKGLLEFGGELNIYDEKVVVALPKKKQRMITVIESKIFFNILTAMFDIVWGVAKPIKHK